MFKNEKISTNINYTFINTHTQKILCQKKIPSQFCTQNNHSDEITL